MATLVDAPPLHRLPVSTRIVALFILLCVVTSLNAATNDCRSAHRIAANLFTSTLYRCWRCTSCREYLRLIRRAALTTTNHALFTSVCDFRLVITGSGDDEGTTASPRGLSNAAQSNDKSLKDVLVLLVTEKNDVNNV